MENPRENLFVHYTSIMYVCVYTELKVGTDVK